MAEFDERMTEGLDAVRELFPPTPEGGEVAARVTEKMHDFALVHQAAVQSEAEAEGFVNNLDTIRAGLVNAAKNTPATAPLLLDLVPLLVGPMLPEDSLEHVVPLAGHIQSEIARAAVQSFAIRDEPVARAAMDRYNIHLNDDDRTVLGGFIETMALARATDQVTQQIEQQRGQQIASDTRAHGYFSGLSDPNTGEVRFPPGWLPRLAADEGVTPETKAVLWEAHDRLWGAGDLRQSDARTVVDLVGRAARGAVTPTEVWSRVGDDLALADAQMLAGAAFPKSPQHKAEVESLHATLTTARRLIASPENGTAGQFAFERFVGWLLPEYRRAGPGSLNPKSDNWILGTPDGGPGAIDQFMPRGGDVVEGMMRPMGGETRPSLSDIFGGRR